MSGCKVTKASCKPPPKPKKVCKPPSKKSDGIPWPEIEFPHSLRILGPKHFEAAKNFIPSMIVFSTAALLGVVYFTEFRTVLQYLPFYGSKYAKPEDDDD